MKEGEIRTDLELVDAANRGDARAFEALYRRHRDWVVRLAWRMTGNEHDALDVMQETFTYLLRKFPGFKLTASLRTLLYVAARNRSIDVRRRKTRMEPINHEIAENATGAQNHAPMLQNRENPDLKTAFKCLTELQYETLLMRFADGLELKEIAAALDIPIGTVKSRLHSALDALRRDPRARDYFS